MNTGIPLEIMYGEGRDRVHAEDAGKPGRGEAARLDGDTD